MDAQTVFYWKLAVALCTTGIFLCGWMLFRNRFYELIARPGLYLFLLSVQRLSIFISAFWFLRADIPDLVHDDYSVQAWVALTGRVPMRDGNILYGLYFDYFNALFLSVVNHPLTLVFVYTLFECVAAWLFMKVAHRVYPLLDIGRAAWMYLWNPCSILFIVLGGANDTLVMLMASLTFWALAVGNGLTASLAAATAPFLSNATALWLLVPLTAQRRDRSRRIGLYGAATLLLLLPPLLFLGVPFEKWLFHHALKSWTSGTIWFLLSIGTPLPPPGIFRWAPLALTLTALVGCWLRVSRLKPPGLLQLLASWIFVTVAVLLLFSRAFPSYLLPAVLPICLMVAHLKRRWLFWVWVIGSGVAALEQHLRFLWIGGWDPIPPFSLWIRQMAIEGTFWKAWVFGAMEAALLLYYVTVALNALRQISPAPNRLVP